MNIDKEDLSELLKENLTIEVSVNPAYDPFGHNPPDEIIIKIYFANELVAEGSS